MTRPTKNPAIKEGVIVRILIFMVSLPTARTRSASIVLRKWCIATYCWMSMRYYPAFTFAPRCNPGNFHIAIRKSHNITSTQDIRIRIIALAKGMSSYMVSGRIGAWKRTQGVASIAGFSASCAHKLMRKLLFTKLPNTTEKMGHCGVILGDQIQATYQRTLLASEMLRTSRKNLLTHLLVQGRREGSPKTNTPLPLLKIPVVATLGISGLSIVVRKAILRNLGCNN